MNMLFNVFEIFRRIQRIIILLALIVDSLVFYINILSYAFMILRIVFFYFFESSF
jgi:hypothetical protein